MNQTYYTVLTKQGAALLANATALGVPLKITQMAVGDGNDNIPKPNANQTQLVHEVRRAAVNTLFVDQENPNQIIAEQIIPESEGGWFIHEIGLFDEYGNLIAVGNCPSTYKPKLAEGSGRTQIIRMVIIVDNTQSVELKIDPAVVLATRQYTNDQITAKMTAHEKSTNHPTATTSSKGFVQLNSATDSTIESQAATPKAVRDAYDHASNAHNRITDVNNVLLNVTDRLRTPDFESELFSADKRYLFVVRNDGVAGVYNTYKNDFSWFFNSDGWCGGFIEAPRVGGLDQFVRDRTPPVGVPLPWPQVYPPAGYFECNGSTFNRDHFPKLAAAYPSGKLPDLRGEFIRGWDNARGADPYRVILDWQGDAIRNIYGEISPISESFAMNPITTGVFSNFQQHTGHTPIHIDGGPGGGVSFDASRVVPVAHENRPRNIAFMYIVKAE
ncbi:Phage-related tail fiber protein [Gilliamella apicola SCGC AB-598-I20]|nr:Phage-related tail fiber protein [Gilliamella apicola SCGC AB-598-I20]